MTSANPQHLITALTNGFSSDAEARAASEKYLLSTPGLLPLLLATISEPSLSQDVRTAALIAAKNRVRDGWRGSLPLAGQGLATMDTLAELHISDEEKSSFRCSAIPLLSHLYAKSGGKAEVKFLDTAIRTVMNHDLDFNLWPGIYAQALKELDSGTPAGTLTFLTIVKNALGVLYFSNKNADFQGLYQQAVPRITLLCEQIMQSFDGTNGTSCFFGSYDQERVTNAIVKCADKLMRHHQTIIDKGYDVSIIKAPLSFTVAVLRTQIPQCEDFEESRLSVAAAAQKNCIQVMRLFSTFSEAAKSLGLDFESEVQPQILQSCMAILNQPSYYKHCRPVTVAGAICLLTKGLEKAVTYQEILPNIDTLIKQVCFPMCCYSGEDIEQWQEDPASIARTSGLDYSKTYDPRSAAPDFVGSLCRLRGKEWLTPILSFIEEVLSSVASSPSSERVASQAVHMGSDSRKYGALMLLKTITPRLTKRKVPLDRLFSDHIVPEFKSLNPLLRFVAVETTCAFLPRCGSEKTVIDWLSAEAVVVMYKCNLELISDKEVPIKTAVVNCLQRFFEIADKETLQPALRDVIVETFQHVLSELLNLASNKGDMDVECVTLAVESLVMGFAEEVLPFCSDIVKLLCGKITILLQELEQTPPQPEDEWDDRISFGIRGCFEAIDTVLNAIDASGKKELFVDISKHILPICVPVMAVQIEFGMLSLSQEVLALLANLTFTVPVLTEDFWYFYGLMYAYLIGGPYPKVFMGQSSLSKGGDKIPESDVWSEEELEAVIRVLDNYMTRDPHQFITGACVMSDGTTKTYLDMTLEIVRFYTDPTENYFLRGDLHVMECLSFAFEGLFQANPQIQCPPDFMRESLRIVSAYLEALGVKAAGGEKSPLKSGQKQPAIGSAMRLWATMILVDSALFFNTCDELGIRSGVMQCFAGIETEYPMMGLDGPRVALLGYCKMLQMVDMNDSSIGGSNGHVVCALFGGMKKCLEQYNSGLQAQLKEFDLGDYDLDEDSEQELEANQDRKSRYDHVSVENYWSNYDDAFDSDFIFASDAMIRKTNVTELNELTTIKALFLNHGEGIKTAVAPEEVQSLMADAEIALHLKAAVEEKRKLA